MDYCLVGITPNVLQLLPVLEDTQMETRECWAPRVDAKREEGAVTKTKSAHLVCWKGKERVVSTLKFLQATWDFFWAFFPFLSQNPSPILACKSFPPHPTQSPTFYPELFNQLKLSCVFLEGFPPALPECLNILGVCPQFSKTSGRPIGHSSDFKYTLTFSFQPNILLLPHRIASELPQACCPAPDIPLPVDWG